MAVHPLLDVRLCLCWQHRRLPPPPIVKAAINEIVDAETLGGAAMHTTVSGVPDSIVDTEDEALDRVREIIAAIGLPETPVPPRAVHPPLFDASELTNLQLAGALGVLVAFLAIELTVEALLVGSVFRLGCRRRERRE